LIMFMAKEQQYRDNFFIDEENEEEGIQVDVEYMGGNIIPNTNIIEMGMSVNKMLVDVLGELGKNMGNQSLNLGFFCGMILDGHLTINEIPKKHRDEVSEILAYVYENYVFDERIQDPPYSDIVQDSLIQHRPGMYFKKMFDLVSNVTSESDLANTVSIQDDPIIVAAYDRGLVPCYRSGPFIKKGKKLQHVFEVIGKREMFVDASPDLYMEMIKHFSFRNASVFSITCKSAYNAYLFVIRANVDCYKASQAYTIFLSRLTKRDLNEVEFRAMACTGSVHHANFFVSEQKKFLENYKGMLINRVSVDWIEKHFRSAHLYPTCHLHGELMCIACTAHRKLYLFRTIKGSYAAPFFEYLLSTLSCVERSYMMDQIRKLRSLRDVPSVVADLFLVAIQQKKISAFVHPKVLKELKIVSYPAPYFYLNYSTVYDCDFPSRYEVEHLKKDRNYDRFYDITAVKKKNQFTGQYELCNYVPRRVRKKGERTILQGQIYDHHTDFYDVLYNYNTHVTTHYPDPIHVYASISIMTYDGPIASDTFRVLTDHGYTLGSMQMISDLCFSYVFKSDERRGDSDEMDEFSGDEIE